jgi:hypothetical protein
MNIRSLFKSFVMLAAVAAPTLSLGATGRTTISLNGTWQIEDSKDAEAIPVAWNRKVKVAVPGLAHSAEPAFPQVDQFDSRMSIQNRVGEGKLPKTAIVYNAGVSRQERNWFWYRRTFDVSDAKSVAILRINKAQFGAAVWLNGVKVGDHLPCFTAVVNDEDRQVEGTLTLALENSKSERGANQTSKFTIAPLGQNTSYNDFKFPKATGDFLLRAMIECGENGPEVSTQSRRYVKVSQPSRKGH